MTQRNSSSPSTAQNICKIKVSKIQADTVRTAALRTGRFFITAKVNDDTRKTTIEVAESGWVLWDDQLHFDAPSGASITLTLCASHRVRHDTVVGFNKEKICSDLWSTNSVERRLRNESGTLLSTHIHFKVELLPDSAPPALKRQASADTKASKAHDVQIGESIQLVVGTAFCPVHVPVAEVQARDNYFREDKTPDKKLDLGELAPTAETWNVLLQHVGIFTDIVSQIAEVHPYAKFALSVLTMAQKVVLAQQERDDKLQKLVKLTSDLYSFLNKLRVAGLDGHRSTMKLLTLQTTECGYFIRDYTKHKSFMVRAAKSAIFGSMIDEKIAGYEKKIGEIKAAFRHQASLNIEIAVVRIAEQIERLATEIVLDDLPYASGACFDRGKQRLPGTRVSALEKIFEWINDLDKPRVLVLSGPAGCGKSTIAHSVAHTFDELKRLGSSFFFDRDAQHERRPSMLFSTVTRDLADLDAEWKASVKQVIGSRARRRTASLLEQFEEFLLKPARSSDVYFGPVVIVIDALEASGDIAHRRELLSLLSKRATELPRNFRILITTRPEDDIMHAFTHGNNVACWDMDTIVDKESNSDDIAAYFSHHLAEVPELRWCEKSGRKLAAKVDGDFAWATTICSFVKEHVPGQTADERMSRILSTPAPREVAESDKEESHLDAVRGTLRRTLHLRPRSRPSSVSAENQLSKLDYFFHPRPLSFSEYSDGSADSRPHSPSHAHSPPPSVHTPSLHGEGSFLHKLHLPHFGSRPPSRESLRSPQSQPKAHQSHSSLHSKFTDTTNSRPPSRGFTFPKPHHYQQPASKFPVGIGEDDIPVLTFQPTAPAPFHWNLPGISASPTTYTTGAGYDIDDDRSSLDS